MSDSDIKTAADEPEADEPEANEPEQTEQSGASNTEQPEASTGPASEHLGSTDAAVKSTGRSGRPQRRRWIWWALMGVVALVLIVAASGSPPTEGVSQNRLFNIASQLKCVECVGESVASSSAPIAVQFRQEISTQMAKGKTNDEILNFFAARYDDILLTPPSSGLGALVWVIPVVALFAATVLLGSAFRTWKLDRSERHASTEDVDLVAAAMGGDPGEANAGISDEATRD